MEDEITKMLAEKKPQIDAAIKKYLPEKFTEEYMEWAFGKPRYKYDSNTLTKALAEPVWDFLNRGGKRWRPALFLLIADAIGGDTKKLQDFVVVLELIHEGSLVVDDIEDRSELRRGQPCMHIKFGIDVAINAGNFMYFLPMLSLVKNKKQFTDATLLKAYETIIQELINIHCGQGMDIIWHNGNVGADQIGEKEYMQMCAYKTGTLARLAAKLAVILSGGNDNFAETMGKFGESIGVAFQIQDDILNLKESLGKEFGEDIKEGKRTLMVIHTLKQATEAEKKTLVQILNSHTNDRKKIQEAIGIITKYKSMEYAKSAAREIISSAWADADKILKDSPAKTNLKKFAEFLINREI